MYRLDLDVWWETGESLLIRPAGTDWCLYYHNITTFHFGTEDTAHCYQEVYMITLLMWWNRWPSNINILPPIPIIYKSTQAFLLLRLVEFPMVGWCVGSIVQCPHCYCYTKEGKTWQLKLRPVLISARKSNQNQINLIIPTWTKLHSNDQFKIIAWSCLPGPID